MSTNLPTGDFPTGPYGNAFIPQGWLCPRCDVVNAPHVHQCYCHAYQYIATTGTEPIPDPSSTDQKQYPLNPQSTVKTEQENL